MLYDHTSNSKQMRHILFTSLLFLSNYVTAQSTQQNDKTVEVLKQLLAKLSSYETLSYKYYRSLHYFSENYHRETDGNIFLDFRTNDTVLGFKYQAENKSFKSVYNGSEYFYLDKDDKTMQLSFKAQIGHFESSPGFSNSIITLKKVLPEIISNVEVLKSISDTTINTQTFHVVSFILQNKTITNLGSYSPVSLKRDFLYKILIDKTTLLPIQVIQTNSAEPQDYILTSFSNLKPSINELTENSWYYSTYKNDFKPSSDKKAELIKTNVLAPDWEAIYFNTNDKISLSKLKGKVVLLDFWIKNCGYCIASVPELNNIIKKYSSNGLTVIGINKHDKKADIAFFYEKFKPNFNTVYDSNGKITTAYGIDGFPTIVIIDKEGKVIYAGGFDKELIDGILKTSFE